MYRKVAEFAVYSHMRILNKARKIDFITSLFLRRRINEHSSSTEIALAFKDKGDVYNIMKHPNETGRFFYTVAMNAARKYDAKTMLEVGCGEAPGYYPDILDYNILIASDIYKPIIKKSKKRFPRINWQVIDLFSLSKNSYDMVVTVSVAIHYTSNEVFERIVEASKKAAIIHYGYIKEADGIEIIDTGQSTRGHNCQRWMSKDDLIGILSSIEGVKEVIVHDYNVLFGNAITPDKTLVYQSGKTPLQNRYVFEVVKI
jgi:hypothetical protein